MSLGPDEVNRIVDAVDADRTISKSVYCGECGYNLRYRKFIDRCPECGNRYNARPGVMKGILTSDDASFPGSHLALILACLIMGIWVLSHAFTPVNDWLIIIGGGLTLVALRSALSIYGDLKRYVRYARIRRRIERDQED